jgi:hypothetical protein
LFFSHDEESIFSSLSEFKVIEGVLHDDNDVEPHEDKDVELLLEPHGEQLPN